MVHPNRRTPLTGVLIERIQREGPLSFADFMEVCLYHPQYGYYTGRVPNTGRRDYFTSPEVGPLFGRLLAWQFCEMWDRLGRPARFELVECGAGDGRLARDILTSVKQQGGGFHRALHYLAVEKSGPRGEAVERQLQIFADAATYSGDLPAGPVVGCIFSNELLDALPVHRVVQREGGLREILVGLRKGAKGVELAEVEGDLTDAGLGVYLGKYGAPLEVGQVAEVHLNASGWLERAAASLQRGFLLTIDYGYRARELYGPGRLRGTLLAYRDHRSNEDWLGWPGLQDLTAHVNFTALEEQGAVTGLRTVGLVPQTQFLLNLARVSGLLRELEQAAGKAGEREWIEQFKLLIHPGGMGEIFKVLGQSKGMGESPLSGFAPL